MSYLWFPIGNKDYIEKHIEKKFEKVKKEFLRFLLIGMQSLWTQSENIKHQLKNYD